MVSELIGNYLQFHIFGFNVICSLESKSGLEERNKERQRRWFIWEYLQEAQFSGSPT